MNLLYTSKGYNEHDKKKKLAQTKILEQLNVVSVVFESYSLVQLAMPVH